MGLSEESPVIISYKPEQQMVEASQAYATGNP